MISQLKVFGDKTYSPRLDGYEVAERIQLSLTSVHTAAKHNTYASDTIVAVMNGHLLPIVNNSCNSMEEDDIWSVFERVLAKYPDDIFAALPSDMAENHDRYLHGEKK